MKNQISIPELEKILGGEIVFPIEILPNGEVVEKKLTGEKLMAGTLNIFGFSHALNLLKDGFKVCRTGWNGKGMWLALVSNWHCTVGIKEAPRDDLLPFIGMKTADDKFVPWLCSQTDMLAEDWEVVE